MIKEGIWCPYCKADVATAEEFPGRVDDFEVTIIKTFCRACAYYHLTVRIDGKTYIERDGAAYAVSKAIMDR